MGYIVYKVFISSTYLNKSETNRKISGSKQIRPPQKKHIAVTNILLLLCKVCSMLSKVRKQNCATVYIDVYRNEQMYRRRMKTYLRLLYRIKYIMHTKMLVALYNLFIS